MDERIKNTLKLEFNNLLDQIITKWDNILDVDFSKEIRLRTHIIDIKVNVKENLILD